MPATLDIPEGVTAIDDYVFEEAWRVSTVNLPSTLKSIGTGAFSSCERLTTVNGLTDSVEVAPFAFHMTPFDEARPFGLDVVDDRVMGFHGRPCPSALELPEGHCDIVMKYLNPKMRMLIIMKMNIVKVKIKYKH